MKTRAELETAVHVLVEEVQVGGGDGSFEPTPEDTTAAIMALIDEATAALAALDGDAGKEVKGDTRRVA